MKTANQIIRFTKGAAVVLLIVISLDFVIGNVLRHSYFRLRWGKDFRTTYSIDTTTAGLLVFGSSRSYTHYVPDVLERSFNLQSYNVGRDAVGVLYHSAILAGVLKRYKPKAIILDINYNEFEKSQHSYDSLAPLLPYYKNHPEIRGIVCLRSKFEKIKLLSQIYPFNSNLLTILMGNLESNREKWADRKGFIPLSGKWSLPIQNKKVLQPAEIDPVLVQYFEWYVKKTIRENIELIVMVSPLYSKSENDSPSINVAKEICKKMRILFLDYSQSEYFLSNPGLFHDPEHLNYEGAQFFSTIAAKAISNSRATKLIK